MAATIGLSGNLTRHEAAVMRALNRANAEGTHGKLVYAGQHSAICKGNGGFAYLVTRSSCTCTAGLNGMTCKHKVAWLDKIGDLDSIVPNFYARVILPAPDGQAAA